VYRPVLIRTTDIFSFVFNVFHAPGLCWGKTRALHGMLMCIPLYLYGISSYVWITCSGPVLGKDRCFTWYADVHPVVFIWYFILCYESPAPGLCWGKTRACGWGPQWASGTEGRSTWEWEQRLNGVMVPERYEKFPECVLCGWGPQWASGTEGERRLHNIEASRAVKSLPTFIGASHCIREIAMHQHITYYILYGRLNRCDQFGSHWSDRSLTHTNTHTHAHTHTHKCIVLYWHVLRQLHIQLLKRSMRLPNNVSEQDALAKVLTEGRDKPPPQLHRR
jgi:hypothetical protein